MDLAGAAAPVGPKRSKEVADALHRVGPPRPADGAPCWAARREPRKQGLDRGQARPGDPPVPISPGVDQVPGLAVETISDAPPAAEASTGNPKFIASR